MGIEISKSVKEQLVKAYKKLDDVRAILENANDDSRLIAEEAEDDSVWSTHDDMSDDMDSWLAQIESLESDMLHYLDLNEDILNV